MQKITRLTRSQENRFPEFVEKWTKIGLNCDPVDLNLVGPAVNKCYRLAGLPTPQKIVVSDSPLSGAIVHSVLKDKNVRASVRDSVRASVWASVRDSVRASVWASVRDSVWDSVWRSVWASVWDSVRASVWDSVRASVYGPHDAGWLSFYDYMREVLGLEEQTEKVTGLLSLAKLCGWWIPCENVAIVQHRHSRLCLDEDGQLHSENSMACEYRDGWGIWAIHGVRVDEQVVLRPESQTVAQINSESNEEVRRIRVERFGVMRYIEESGASVRDSRRNDVENTYEILVDTPHGQRLATHCPSTGRRYFLSLPGRVETCEQAQRAIWGINCNIIGRT